MQPAADERDRYTWLFLPHTYLQLGTDTATYTCVICPFILMKNVAYTFTQLAQIFRKKERQKEPTTHSSSADAGADALYVFNYEKHVREQRKVSAIFDTQLLRA